MKILNTAPVALEVAVPGFGGATQGEAGARSIPKSPHMVLRFPVAGPGAEIMESLLLPVAVVV